MSNENEPDVKLIERVEVAPAGGENADEPETETQPDSSQEEKKDGEAEAAEPEGTEEKPDAEPEGEEAAEPEKPAPKNAAPSTDDGEKYGDVKRIPSETNREFALRIENARLRGEIRGKQGQEILTPSPQQPAIKKELTPDKKKILDQYQPEEVEKARQFFEVVAEDMGFVKKDQIGAFQYQEKATEVLDGFLEKHPEYLPQNDQGGVLWNTFKGEFGLYRPAQSPKELNRILEKVHKEVFGIKPAAALKTNAAARKNVEVASHGSASRPAPSREGVRRSATPAAQGLRTDMLKGFSEEEIAEFNQG